MLEPPKDQIEVGERILACEFPFSLGFGLGLDWIWGVSVPFSVGRPRISVSGGMSPPCISFLPFSVVWASLGGLSGT